jgi:hypothetical protein
LDFREDSIPFRLSRRSAFKRATSEHAALGARLRLPQQGRLSRCGSGLLTRLAGFGEPAHATHSPCGLDLLNQSAGSEEPAHTTHLIGDVITTVGLRPRRARLRFTQPEKSNPNPHHGARLVCQGGVAANGGKQVREVRAKSS